MKTLKPEFTTDTFNEFLLSNEEMIYVRGGEGDPVIYPTTPPVKI
jgi:hypothetical protein